ncbi:MAG: sulfite exporter TauE/SafE family protein [Acidimicrobiales bacterium]
MTAFDVVLLIVGGAFAGVINAMAGGGSMLTVPLLVIAGVPGVAANGSNRVGILTSTYSSIAGFRKEGVKVAVRTMVPILGPAIAGSLLGAYGIGQLADDNFERLFGLLMIPLIILTVRKPRVSVGATVWPLPLTVTLFFLIGIYAGAIQAGVGLLILTALSRSGLDLVTANVMKVTFNFTATAIALPVFIWQGNVRWGPAIVLAAGLTVGGWLGARFAVRGGERWIRWVMIVSALALAVRLIAFAG